MFAQIANLGMQLGGTLFGMNEAENAAARAAVAAEKASLQQVRGLENAIGERRAGTDTALGYLQQLAPFAQSGIGANKTLSDALGLNGPDAQRAYFSGFQNDPGYMSTLKAGTDAIEQSQAGAGLLKSGGTLKALQDYGGRLMQSMFADRLNRIAGIGATGQNAATTMATGSAGIVDSSTNAIANYLRDIGTAHAGGTINASNADQRGTQNVLSMLGYGMGQMKSGINDLIGQFKMPSMGSFGGGSFAGAGN
jgi:hypothetical protein